MTTVRELITRIGFDVDTKALDKANKSIDAIKSSLLGIGKVALGASAAIFALVKSTASMSEDIGINANLIGVSTKSLQQWQFAAQTAGISSDEFVNGMVRFQRGLGNAAQSGVVDDFVKSLNRIGVSITDEAGNLKDTDALLLETSDGLSKVASASERNAIAFQLFGRSGARLTNFLSSGSAEINKLKERAEKLGLVLSGDALKANEKLDDSFDELFATIAGVKNQIGSKLTPAFQELANKVLDWILVNNQLIQQNIKVFIEDVAKVLKALWRIVEVASNVFIGLSKAVGGAENALYLFIVAYTAVKLGGLILSIFDLIVALKAAIVSIKLVNASLLLIPLTVIAVAAAISYLALQVLDFFGLTDTLLGESGTGWLNFAKVFGVVAIAMLLPVGPILKLGAAMVTASVGAWSFAAAFLAAAAPALLLIAGFATVGFAAYKLTELLLSIDWRGILASIGRFFTDFASYVNDQFDNAIKFIKGKWKDLKDWFSNWIDSLLNDFANLSWDGFVDGAIKVFKSIGGFLYDSLKSAIRSVTQDLLEFFNLVESKGKKANTEKPKNPVSLKGLLDEPTDKRKGAIPGGDLLSYNESGNAKPGGGWLSALFSSFGPTGAAASRIMPMVQQMTAPSMQQPKFEPQQLSRAGDSFSNQTKNNNVTVNSNPNIVINVPNQIGSSINSEQSIADSVRRALDDHIDGMLEQGFYNNAVYE